LLQVSGDYSYVSAGTALRNTGSGVITVSYSGKVLAAYLIWGIMDSTQEVALASASINGHAITGTLQSQDYSPCWSPTYMYVFAADVTPYVVSGANTVSGFLSGATDGSDPWSTFAAPMDDGASLVVVYSGATANDIYVYTGTYTEPSAGNPLTSTFNHGAADSTTATTTFIVADGQIGTSTSVIYGTPDYTIPQGVGTPASWGNYAEYNGVTIDSNAFPGADPRTSTATWSYGNLMDTKTYSVSETLGATSDTASVGGGSGGDCLTWIGQVISIPSTATVPPIGVPPSGPSVPEFGSPMLMTLVVAVALVAFLARRKVNIQIPKR